VLYSITAKLWQENSCKQISGTAVQVRPSSGSLLGLCWSADGTSLAACGGNGSLAMAALLDVRLEDGRVAATLEGERLVSVVDCRSETQERLEFRDPVVKMSLGECGAAVLEGTSCTANHVLLFLAGSNCWHLALFANVKSRWLQLKFAAGTTIMWGFLHSKLAARWQIKMQFGQHIRNKPSCGLLHLAGWRCSH
jgi:hypothetical protein